MVRFIFVLLNFERRQQTVIISAACFLENERVDVCLRRLRLRIRFIWHARAQNDLKIKIFFS